MNNKLEQINSKLKIMQNAIAEKVVAQGHSKFLKETGEHLPSPSTLSKFLTLDIYGQIPRNLQVRVIREAIENENWVVLNKLKEFGVFENKTVSAGQKEKAALLANMFYDKLTNDQKSEVFFIKYAAKGTFVHALMEDYFNTYPIGLVNEFQEEHEEFKGNYDAAVNFIRDEAKNIIPIGSEIDVWDPVLNTFGRLDFLCLWDGALTVVDWKTNSSLVVNLTAIQLYVYKMALKRWDIEVEDIIVVKLQKDGTYVKHKYDRNWFETYEKVVNNLKFVHDYKNLVKGEKI